MSLAILDKHNKSTRNKRITGKFVNGLTSLNPREQKVPTPNLIQQGEVQSFVTLLLQLEKGYNLTTV